jgi:cell wall-associated NlpC family hydrolase
MNFRNIVIALYLTTASLPGAASEESPSVLDHYATSAQELVLRALSFVGVGYRRGGESPETGFDCSGLVRHVFREGVGLSLPRTSKDISRVGARVEAAQLEPGDLVFFNTLRDGFSHVGIYLGDHRFVHAPTNGGEVRVEDMRQNYWTRRFDGARRIGAERAVGAR